MNALLERRFITKINCTMTRFYLFLTLVCFCSGFQSCDNEHRKAELVFNEAKDLVEQYPDSALILLSSIHNPDNLDKDQYAEFILLSVLAKDKAYKDIAEDTVIFQVKEYFEERKELEKAAWANFYSGRIHQTRKKKDEAMSSYLKAESFADKTDDNNLKGLVQFFIGNLDYQQFLLEDAIKRFKISNSYFQESQSDKKYKNQIGTFNSIGNSFLLDKQNDSAFYYYNKGLDIAKLEHDSMEQANILQNMGVAYSEIGDYRQAESKYRQAIAISSSEKQKARTYFNLAKCLYNQNNLDSFSNYVNLSIRIAEEINDNSLLLNINKFLSEMEEDSSNDSKALEYYKQYNHYLKLILREKEDFAIVEVQKKYDFEKLKNINNQLMIEKQQRGIVALGLLIIIFLITLYYKQRVRRKNEAMNEAELKIEQLNEMIERGKSEDQDSARGILIHHFNILKKAALLEKYLNDDQRKGGEKVLREFNKVLYEKENGFDWEILYKTMNSLNNGKLDLVRERFSQLDDFEFRICCLVISGFTNPEISLMLNVNVNVVQIRKTRIKKKIEVENIKNMIDTLGSDC